MKVERTVDAGKNLLFYLDDGPYSMNYLDIDKVHKARPVDGKIPNIHSVPCAHDCNYVVGFWTKPVSNETLLLFDLRLWLGFEKKPYSKDTVVMSLFGQDVKKYALVVDGRLEAISKERVSLENLVVTINPRDVVFNEKKTLEIVNRSVLKLY